ncbi:FHA domain-containing protein [Citricoccus sp.]|uniref:FHA domain-containing protein n=1 Tax=Citricoccus sp. TaxID=1978372 RepID=UPI002BEA2A60|nr:FHA domain-containing protein [Citricoccus sp.]HRO92529.1 FHA domain-containing protein [Citricoccus sp.]
MTPTAMVRYSAGPWLGLVRGRSLVALPADASEETAAVLWDLLAGTPGVEHLLATVLSGRLDLTGMPAFAIVSYAGQDVHAILRGDVHLRMTGLDDVETRLSGTGVSTWAERIVPGVRSFELLVDDALPDAEDLPLEAGAVRLAALQADLVSAASGDPESCPEARTAHHLAPVAAPTPAAPPTGPAAPSEPGRAADPVPPAESADVGDGAVTGHTDDGEGCADAEDGAGHAAPAMGDQPAGESDIDMTIAPDTAEYLSSPSASDAPESSGRTTLVQPAEDGTASREETDVEAPSEAGPGEDVERGTVADPAPASAASAPVRPASRAPESQELIDSVPWLAAARSAVPAPGQPGAGRPDEGRPDGGSPVPAVPAEPGRAGALGAHPEDDVDADTVLSPSAAALAAAGPAPADRTPAPPSGPAPGTPTAVPADPDHDGETVMRSDLDLAGVETVDPAVPEAPASPATGPMVLARQCSTGHANPPTSSTCARCGQSLGGEARQVRRPPLGRIRMSTGEVLELDRPVVIGRQPQAHRVGSGTMPRMIQVRSPHGDISRSHCEVVLEGWHVQLRDLKATNGTVLIREGAAPRRLGQGEAVMVLDGDIADLGDGVSLRFEAIP